MGCTLLPWLDPWPRLALEQAELLVAHLKRDNPDPEYVRRHATLLMLLVSDEGQAPMQEAA